MDNPIALLSPQYVISDLTSTSQQVTLTDNDVNTSRVIVDNSLGTTSAFVTSGADSTTAVYPTSATVPSNGAIVGAGTVQTFTKNPTHRYIAAIRESGTADLPIKVGTGE